MGNILFYLNEYDDIIMNVNSFSPTGKKFNYVIFKFPHNDDEENDKEQNTNVNVKYNH